MKQTNKTAPHAYDAVYKKFFNNPLMVESLLSDFIAEDLLLHFDFSTLERCNESYVSDKFQRRSNDVVWRVRLQNPDGTETPEERWCYLYLLIEFQSSPDYWMPVRILAYTSLLWQSLIERGELKTGSYLPPVLPIVIYNGGNAWKAKTNVTELIANTHEILQKYQPSQEYFLLDENVFDKNAVEQKRGLTALLLRLDRAKTPEAVEAIAQVLISELKRPEYESIRKTFMALLSVVANDYTDNNVDIPHQNLTEAYSMLAENIRNMVNDSHLKGLTAGRAEGLTAGRTEGMRNTIMNFASIQWGTLPHDLTAKLKHISSAEQLEALSLLLFRSKSLQEFEAIVEDAYKKAMQ
ncbi:MAG: Rpn family recombination-promoting nuclease/putative transposase [Pseudomonadota bacterium]